LSKNIYVGTSPTAPGRLPRLVLDWTVTQARVAADRLIWLRGFVLMADGADNAISALNGFYLEGRPLIVNEDRPHRRRGGQSRQPKLCRA
jgi:hypothetical protein